MRQLIYSRLYCIYTLCSAIAAVCTCCLNIGVYNFIIKVVGLKIPIQCNGLMPRQTHSCRAVISICACIGKGFHLNSLYNTILIRSNLYMDLHLMTGRGTDQGLVAAVNDLGGTAGQPGNNCRVNLANLCLLGTKAASDTRLDHTNLRGWNSKGISKDSSKMERNLCRGYHIQSSKMILGTVSTEGFHHTLLVCLCMVNLIYRIFAAGKNSVNVTHFLMAFGSKVSFVVSTYRELGFPVLFRMNKNRIVFGCMHIQNRCFHTVFHFNAFQGKVNCRLCLTCYNCYCISHKTQMLIQDQSVIGAEFRISLPCRSKPLLRNIFPGKNAGNTICFFRILSFDLLYPGIGIRTS